MRGDVALVEIAVLQPRQVDAATHQDLLDLRRDPRVFVQEHSHGQCFSSRPC